MKAMLDHNVWLDVIQCRAPFMVDASRLVSHAIAGEFEAVAPAHALTTIFYLEHRANGHAKAYDAVRGLLRFTIPPLTQAVLHRAEQLGIHDFEDAVVASLAEASQCDFIVTRNQKDFRSSPVATLSPAEFLALLGHP
jgi:predicted nucleic acid-binding protein